VHVHPPQVLHCCVVLEAMLLSIANFTTIVTEQNSQSNSDIGIQITICLTTMIPVQLILYNAIDSVQLIPVLLLQLVTTVIQK